jgi:hypothetical protein
MERCSRPVQNRCDYLPRTHSHPKSSANEPVCRNGPRKRSRNVRQGPTTDRRGLQPRKAVKKQCRPLHLVESRDHMTCSYLAGADAGEASKTCRFSAERRSPRERLEDVKMRDRTILRGRAGLSTLIPRMSATVQAAAYFASQLHRDPRLRPTPTKLRICRPIGVDPVSWTPEDVGRSPRWESERDIQRSCGRN